MTGVTAQEMIIERLHHFCQQDERIVAAMLYGSFARDEGDRFSDIDSMLFFDDELLADVDQRAWAGQLAPLELFYVNEFGNSVAIFSNLVRAEFHFDPASEMSRLESYRGNVWFPSLASTILVDRTGRLTEQLRPLIGPPRPHDKTEEVEHTFHSFLNWFLMGCNTLARGEMARALEVLSLVQDNLLRLVRLAEGTSENWITPTKALEKEISAAAYNRFVTCTAPLDRDALWVAYRAAWRWSLQLMPEVAGRHGLGSMDNLVEMIGRRLEQNHEVTQADL
jgi:lincosamide nucleotidyltransferase